MKNLTFEQATLAAMIHARNYKLSGYEIEESCWSEKNINTKEAWEYNDEGDRLIKARYGI